MSNSEVAPTYAKMKKAESVLATQISAEAIGTESLLLARTDLTQNGEASQFFQLCSTTNDSTIEMAAPTKNKPVLSTGSMPKGTVLVQQGPLNPDSRVHEAHARWCSRVALITKALEAWSPDNPLTIPSFASDVEVDEQNHCPDGSIQGTTGRSANNCEQSSAVVNEAQSTTDKTGESHNLINDIAKVSKRKIVYDEDQRAAIEAAKNGESFFLTGSAGTGKSFVLKQIIRELRSQGLKVVVTASTGCAAVAIQGCTIHSATGVGLGLDSIESLKKKVQMKGWVRQLLLAPDVLIIDEVSMLDAIIFDKIEAMYRQARTTLSPQFLGALRKRKRVPLKEDLPFGGLQVIACGDFFQLPPVAPSDPKLQHSKLKMFAFESKAWKLCIQRTISLRQVHRQADRNFVGLLNEIRHGIVSRHTMRVMSACRVVGSVDEVDNTGAPVCYTKLFAFRRQVEAENERRLNELSGRYVAYCAKDQVNTDNLGILTTQAVQGLLDNVIAPRRIVLKKGARVLCVKNVSQIAGIVNGSAGTVIGFTMPKQELMRRRLVEVQRRHEKLGHDGEPNFEKGGCRGEEGVKLKVKMEGTENSKEHGMVEVSVKNASESLKHETEDEEKEIRDDGLLVADLKDAENEGDISNVEPLGGVRDAEGRRDVSLLEPLSIDGLMADEIVDIGHETLMKYTKDARYTAEDGAIEIDFTCGDAIPVVRFDNGVVATMYAESWTVHGMHGQEVGERKQIPLALGWAMTIHKAQGMTLDKVETDVGKAFDYGQVYVALSRATSMQGLRVTTFNAARVMAHEKVEEFYTNQCSEKQSEFKQRRLGTSSHVDSQMAT